MVNSEEKKFIFKEEILGTYFKSAISIILHIAYIVVFSNNLYNYILRAREKLVNQFGHKNTPINNI